MNLLFVGSGNAGSWQIRGVQIGAALGARVTTQPTEADFEWADVAVLVKRGGMPYAGTARRHGCVVVWDALDFWSQPAENGLSERESRALLQRMLNQVQPDLFIGATQAMAEAVGGVFLPHHAWPGLTPAPARENVSVVAYQGNPAYLGRWEGWVREACEARGWTFQINPADLRDADILVAFRDGQWDGWMCREWKSGVKLVNALAAGRPILTQDSAAIPVRNGHVVRVDSHAFLGEVLDEATTYAVRMAVAEFGLRTYGAVTIESVADQYRQVLERVACPA